MTDEQSPLAEDPNATVLQPNVAPPPRRAAGARLSVSKGPKAGTEFTLGPGETSIGRQGDNTIVIPDISVSRKHIVVRKDGAAFILVDQGSGNGTMLNGSRVAVETELQDGDVIVMGDTEMTFLAARAAPAPRPSRAMPAAAPRRGAPAPAPRALARRQQLGAESAREDTGTGEVQFDPGSSHKAKRKRLFIAVGAVLLFVVILGIVKVRMNAIAANNQAIDEQKAQQAAEDEVNKYYEDSKKQITSGNFKAALSNLKTAISKSKEYGLDERELQRRYDFVASELKNQEAIDAAKEMCDRGELAAAVEKLKTIPEDSFFRDKVSEIIEGCKKKIPDRVSQGKAAVEAKNWDAAKQAFTDITAVDPNNADAAQLSKDIEKAGVVVPVKVRPVGPKVTVCDEATAKALESFAAGKIDEAIGYTSTGGEDAKCKALKANLTAFKEAYLNLDGEGNVEKALAALRAIPGGTSTAYAAKIAQQGSGAFVKEGLKAMSADNFPKAFAAFSQAHTADPGNEVVNRNLGIIHQKAKELNEQAYIDIQQDPDKARKELEQILAMTGKDDPLHAKSVTRLKKLSGGGGGD